MKPKLIPLLALASCLTFAATACNKDNDNGAAATATDTATPAATGTTVANDHAAKFLADAVQADNAEIKFGKKAADDGSTKAVKDFGQMLADDHGKHKDMVKMVADGLNIDLPDGTTPDADSEYNMATSMSGAGFDKDFLSAMVKDHQKAIDMFQQEADSSDPTAVTDLAKQTLPTLKKHLQTAQSLQK